MTLVLPLALLVTRLAHLRLRKLRQRLQRWLGQALVLVLVLVPMSLGHQLQVLGCPTRLTTAFCSRKLVPMRRRLQRHVDNRRRLEWTLRLLVARPWQMMC